MFIPIENVDSQNIFKFRPVSKSLKQLINTASISNIKLIELLLDNRNEQNIRFLSSSLRKGHVEHAEDCE